ncbi:MAG: DUF2169 domain-containing protein [Thermodesulfobacteriota bacterium]
MKVIKTRKQSILCRPFEKRNSFYFSIAVLHFFAFDRPGLLPETDLWPLAAKELGQDMVLDYGLPKTRGEVLIAGKCFAPGGEPVNAAKVGFRLGPLSKTLYVFGHRYWKIGLPGLQITEPEPFTVMGVDFRHAYGGPGFERNPLGKGFTTVLTADKKEVYPLPNIEHPESLIGSPDDRPDPAGFGPLDISWPQRQSKAGTYDMAWYKERFPGLADDMDPTFFNAAPPDQWLEDYFQGDEAFEFTNMNPEKPMLRGALPGFRARAFINRRTDDAAELLEVRMRPETVWFFPHEERGILIHRGAAPIQTDDAHDVLHLMTAYESLREAPRPFEHYKKEFARRTDEETGFLLILQDKGLAPASEAAGQAAEDAEVKRMYAGEGILAERMKNKAEKERKKAEVEKEKSLGRVRELAKTYGLDPSAFAPAASPPPVIPEPPDLDLYNMDPEKLVAFMKQTEESAKDQQEKMLAEAQARQEQAEKTVKQMCDRHGLDFEKIKAKAEAQKPKRPVFSADETLAGMRKAKTTVQAQVDELCRRMGADFETVLAQARRAPEGAKFPLIETVERLKAIDPDDPELVGKLRRAEEASREAYKKTAHQIPKPKPLTSEEAAKLKEEFLADRARESSFIGKDLAGMDLAGMDLRGLDLREAYLEGADLGGVDLSGADLSGAVLAWADLSGASLRGANLHQACLGQAKLTGADLGDTALTETILAKADLTGGDLTGARLAGADLSGVVLKNAVLSRANLAKAVLLEVDFTGADFQGADLSEAIFIKPKIEGVDFSDALAAGMIMIEPSGRKAVFRRTDLTNARFLQKADLSETDFTEAGLEEANLMEADLTGACLVKARLSKANLMQARLNGADLTGAVARQANLLRTDLEVAKMIGVDLMEALLKNTRLVQSDLRLASLYSAEVMRAVFGRTRLEGANLKMTKIAEWRPDEQD